MDNISDFVCAWRLSWCRGVFCPEHDECFVFASSGRDPRDVSKRGCGRVMCVRVYVQVFIGNLPPEAESRDLHDFFRDYGKINDAWVARKPPGFGFVWFDDERDAVLPTSSRHHPDTRPPPTCV